ncbi:hypothetical protein BC332_13089 [Capsicum chinense]|nr:hypothetical protein BC332_13089 [Capsicum chinense]
MLITSKPTIDVKADIWNMPQLSHLRTDKRAKLPPPTTSTSSTNSYLQTLSLVAPESCKEDVLAKAAFFECLPYLKKLTLSKTRFDWNEANRLGQVLWIEMADFESWEASKCPFPRLRNLVLVSCLNLEALLLELADLDSLQEMTLDNTSKAVKSAKEIEHKRKERQTDPEREYQGMMMH